MLGAVEAGLCVIEVEHIGVALAFQRAGDNFAPGLFDLDAEFVIDWVESHNACTGVSPDIEAEGDAIAEALRSEDPRGVDLPIVPFPHPPLDRV